MSSRVSSELVAILEEVVREPCFPGLFDKILKACFVNLLEETSNLKSIESLFDAASSEEERDTIREIFNILLLTITEFRRKDLVDVEMEVTLKEAGLTDEMTTKFIQRYNQFTSFIGDNDNEKSNLFDSSINFPKLLDVEWNQEYILSTKYIKQLNKDNYHITFSTLDQKNQVKPINFKCSLEQLTELVHKLDAGLRNIEQASDLRHLKVHQ